MPAADAAPYGRGYPADPPGQKAGKLKLTTTSDPRAVLGCLPSRGPSGGRVAVLPAHSHAGRWPASAAAIVASGLALPKLTAHQRQAALARPRAFDVAHEIADDLDLIGLIGRDFNVGELIFDE